MYKRRSQSLQISIRPLLSTIEMKTVFQMTFLLAALTAGCSAAYNQCVTQVRSDQLGLRLALAELVDFSRFQTDIQNAYRKVELTESLDLLDFLTSSTRASRESVQHRLNGNFRAYY